MEETILHLYILVYKSTDCNRIDQVSNESIQLSTNFL